MKKPRIFIRLAKTPALNQNLNVNQGNRRIFQNINIQPIVKLVIKKPPYRSLKRKQKNRKNKKTKNKKPFHQKLLKKIKKTREQPKTAVKTTPNKNNKD